MSRMRLLVMVNPLVNNHFRVRLIFVRHATVSVRLGISSAVDRESAISLSLTKQREHGQRPRFLIAVRSALHTGQRACTTYEDMAYFSG